MQWNKDTVYIADRQEFLQACAKYAEYLKQEIEQRIQRLLAINAQEYDFDGLCKKILDIFIIKAPLQRFIAAANYGAKVSNEELIKESVYLLRQMYSVDLIEQYLPLLKSALSHLRKSSVIEAIKSKKLVYANSSALYQHLLTQLESMPVVCESLTLLTGQQVSSSENLLQATCDLIDVDERNMRRQATAAIVFELLWIDGQKLVSSKELADPLQAFSAALQRIGVMDEKLLEFLLEFVNQQALLGAEKYFDAFLKKILIQKEKSIIEAHLSNSANHRGVMIKIVRKYPVLYPNEPNKQFKSSPTRDAASYTRVYAQSVTTLMISNRGNINVELIDGSLEIFDQPIRDYFLKISAVLQGKKILRGTIGNVNGEIIINHVLSRFYGIADENELKKALIASQDPLAILFIARTNLAIMNMILNSNELLQCICTDKYCDRHIEMLGCLYSKDVKICAELALLADCIKLIRSKDTQEMTEFVKSYFSRETKVEEGMGKDDEKNKEKHRQVDQNAKRLKYLIAAFFSYRGEPAVVVELLKVDEIRQKIDKPSLMNLANHYRDVAKWLMAKQSKQLTSEQIVTLLSKHPQLWSTVKTKDSISRGNPVYAQLNFASLHQLVVSNRNEDSRKHAAKSVFKSTALLPKLYSLSESNPDAFLLCCVDADSKYFDLQDEVKKIVRSAILTAKPDAIIRYIRHLSVVFSAHQFGLFIQELHTNKLAESFVFAHFVAIFSAKIQVEPDLEYELEAHDLAQLISRLLPKHPRLGVVLQNDKMRDYLCQSEDRNIAWTFLNTVMENSQLQCFNNSKFQLNAFKILRQEEIKQMVFSARYAQFMLALFSKDQDAMCLFEQAEVNEPTKLNLILKYATGHQLLLILLRANEQMRQLKLEIDFTLEKMRDHQEKIQDAQRLVALCEAQRNHAPSNNQESPPRNRKLDVLVSLDNDRKAFVEYNLRNAEQVKILGFLEAMSAKILSTKHYLQALLAEDSLGVAERALLIKIFPGIVQSLQSFGLYDSCQESVIAACLFLSPLLSQSDFLNLSCVHSSIEAAYTARLQKLCKGNVSVSASRKIYAIQHCAQGNLMAKALISLCHVKALAEECLPNLYYEQNVLSVLTDGSNTDASLVVTLIESLGSIHQDFAQEFANAYLLAAFSNNDILACILSTPRLQTLLVLIADVGIVAMLMCLHGKSFSNESDWLMFFDRLTQLPQSFAMIKPMLFCHQQRSTLSSLFHLFAKGLNNVFSMDELSVALNEGAFSSQDFVRLLLSEYQQNNAMVCRDHLIQNVELRTLIFNQASVTQLLSVLCNEIRLRLGTQLRQPNVIEVTLLSSPAIDDILRLGQPEQLFELAKLVPELVSRIVALFLENPLQREFIMQYESLFTLLLETATLDQFLAMGLLIKQSNTQLLSQLMRRTDLIEQSKDNIKIRISAQQLVSVITIAEIQQFDYTIVNHHPTQLKTLCNNGGLIAARIFRSEINVMLAAIPLLLRYIKDAVPQVMNQVDSQEFFNTALNDATIDVIVNYFCAAEVKRHIIEQSRHDLQKRIKKLLCQCFLHSSRSQLVRLCDREYVKIIMNGIVDFMINNEIKKIVAKRLIFLFDHLYHAYPHFVVESLIGYELAYKANEIQPGVIYFAPEKEALRYWVRDPQGQVQEGVLTNNDVKSLHPNMIQVMSLDKYRQKSGLDKIKVILPDILHVTAFRKHTHLIHHGNLFELMISTESHLSLFVATSIYQGSERIRDALHKQFSTAEGSPKLRRVSMAHLHQGDDSEGSSAVLKSAIKREGKKIRFSFGGASGESTSGPDSPSIASLQKEQIGL